MLSYDQKPAHFVIGHAPTYQTQEWHWIEDEPTREDDRDPVAFFRAMLWAIPVSLGLWAAAFFAGREIARVAVQLISRGCLWL